MPRGDFELKDDPAGVAADGGALRAAHPWLQIPLALRSVKQTMTPSALISC